MISDHQKMQVESLTVEVNWTPSVVPCKKIKVTMGDRVQIIDHAEFFTMMMLFGDDKQQESLIPTTKTEMRIVERMISIKATKDMKVGEVLSAPYRYPMPETEYQKLKAEKPNTIRLAADQSELAGLKE